MSTCLPFSEIIYLSLPFYHYALLRSYAPGCYGKARKRDDFRRASQSARRLFLHCGPPETFEGNQGLENFRKILVDFIPDDDAHSWISEVVAPGEMKRILVYRRHEDNYPVILALVTMYNKQEDGDENEVEYTDILNWKISSIKEERTTKLTVSQRKLPILFVNFNPDRYFLVGGALCKATSGDPILQRLPGSVDLAVRLDFGYNLLEATYTIWALSKSLNALERELAMPFRAEAPSCSKEIPCVGLEGGGISITDSAWPGILFIAELDFTKPVNSSGIEEKDHMETLKKQGLSSSFTLFAIT
ncbi:hypothetical protein CVT26_012814 [Gymnopilus dilepis]|uniref:Uncharacterized protein n=1 Tax=Gymnopilus dilepis TaxID=231916 RepID=A0A409WDH9_9AGAR|nr:hypothetical protein CVT26_012814 [Gymnopilus dilepis]